MTFSEETWWHITHSVIRTIGHTPRWHPSYKGLVNALTELCGGDEELASEWVEWAREEYDRRVGENR